jgi:hypothetical protein
MRGGSNKRIVNEWDRTKGWKGGRMGRSVDEEVGRGSRAMVRATMDEKLETMLATGKITVVMDAEAPLRIQRDRGVDRGT